MGLVIASTGADFLSGENNNVMADYEGLLKLASQNLFPDPGLRDWDESTGLHRYFTLGAPPAPTHWAPYIRDENNVKVSARQVLGPIPLDTHVYDQEDTLINGPSPVDPIRAVPIAPPIEPDATAYAVSDVVGLPEGYYCIAWGYIPDEDWQKVDAAMTNPGPRSEPFYLGQGQGFMVPTPSEVGSNIRALALWITEPRMDANMNVAKQKARLAPMFVVDRWRVRGIDDFVRVVGPFNRRVGETMPLPDRRNLTFIGKKKDMPKLRVWRDHTKHKHDEDVRCQVGYAFQTDSGIGEVKVDAGWKFVPKGRQILRFIPSDFDVRLPNAESNKERSDEREALGEVDETEEDTTIEDEETDSRGREKEKKQSARIRGWRPVVRWKITDDPNNPDEERGTTEWYMIVDKGKQSGFKEKGENAEVLSGGPDTWPPHARTELRRVDITQADYSGVAEPTEAPEPPSDEFILDLDTSKLTPGKHWVKQSLFVVSGDDEQESETSPETLVPIEIGEGIRIKRPKWHNLLDNDDMNEQDLEDYNTPRGWDILRPTPENITVRNPERGGIVYEDNSNATGTYEAFRSPVATLRSDTHKYILRMKVNINAYQRGRLQAVVEQYDKINGVPQLVGATILRTWHRNTIDKFFEFRLSTNPNDPNNKRVTRLHADTKEIRVRFEGIGNANVGTRNFNVEVSHWGVFRGWGRPRKSKRLDVKRAEGTEPKDVAYPHGGYCVIVEDPQQTNPIRPNYNVLWQETFESATFMNNWTATTVGVATGARGADYAIRGDYGFHAIKNTQGAVGRYTLRRQLPSPATKVYAKTDFFIQTKNAYLSNMFYVHNEAGNNMAVVSLDSNDFIRLSVTGTAGTTTYTSTTKLEAGDLGTLELIVDGGNSTLGRVEVNLSVGGGVYSQLFNITNIDFTGLRPNYISVGGEDSNASALWDFYYDNVTITDISSNDYVYQAGNSIEYYGPYDTPLAENYGPYGVRIPVKALETYTLGANISGMDLTAGSEVFRLRARAADHKILQTFQPLASNLSGDIEWTRYTRTYTMPAGTAYVEIFGNRLGAGTLWIHGIQFEKGSVATEYTDKNALSGYTSVYLTTVPAGIVQGDPMATLAEITDIRDIDTAVTTEAGTSYSLQYRSGNSLNAMGSYTSLVENLNKDHTIIEVRVNLTSTSDTDSPELRRIEMDLERPYAHLLREDGSEFYGGTVIHTMNAEHPTHNVESVQFASGFTGQHVWGTYVTREIPNLTIEAFRPQTVSEIVSSYGTAPLRIQTKYGRFTVRLKERPTFETNPQTRIYLDANGTNFWQRYTATVAVNIEAEEIF